MSHNELNPVNLQQSVKMKRTPQQMIPTDKSYLGNHFVICKHCQIVNRNQKAICCKCKSSWHVKCLKNVSKEDIMAGNWCCENCVSDHGEIIEPLQTNSNVNIIELNNKGSSSEKSVLNNAVPHPRADVRSTHSRISNQSIKSMEMSLSKEIELKEIRDARRRQEEEIDQRRLQRLREAEQDEIRIAEQSRKLAEFRSNQSMSNDLVSLRSSSSVLVENSNNKVRRWITSNIAENHQAERSAAMNLLPVNRNNEESSRNQNVLAWLNPAATEHEFLSSVLVGNLNPANISKNQRQARNVISKELPLFAGNPLHWPQFISAYVNSTQQCGFTDDENISRLQKCLSGDALEAVRTDLFMASTLPSALSTLRMLYGRPDLIFNTAVLQVKSIPPIRLDRMESIVQFSTRVKSLCDIVKASGMVNYLNNPSLLNELVEKMPATMKMEWGRYKQQAALGEEINLSSFNNWLRDSAIIACSVTNTPINICSIDERRQKQKNAVFHAPHKDTKPTTINLSCVICHFKNHSISSCNTFKQMSVQKRWQKVRQHQLCISCLEKHWIRDCKSRKTCGINDCKYPHNQLLHSDPKLSPKFENIDKLSQLNEPSRNIQKSELMVNRVLNVHIPSAKTMYYHILPVVLYGVGGKKVKTYAFLDGGSSITLMEDDLARELGLEGKHEPLTLKWTSDVYREEIESRRVSLKISGLNMSTIYDISNVRTTSDLNLPVQSINIDDIVNLNHLKLLSIQTYDNAVPQILIGLDHYQLIVAQQIKEGEWNDPIAVQTRLGWTLMGGAEATCGKQAILNCHSQLDLHEYVKSFFSFESLGVKIPLNKVESHEDARAREILKNTVKRLPENRFEAGLLWKFNDIVLPNSKTMAIQRLSCFERKMKRDPELKIEVLKQINEYVNKGFLVKLSDEEANRHSNRTWYLPIFSVTNQNKPGKIRLVWDAAATVGNVSLNSNLLVGPDLLQNLVGVLLKFREYPFAISGDIRQMFHQIRIRHEDQDSQRCLFRFNEDDKPSVYRMTVMTFGSASSPTTAQYVKNLNADKFLLEYPRAVDGIQNRHYVDDYLDSFATIEECNTVTQQIIKIHSGAGFDIRNFMSNAPEVLETLNSESSSSSKDLVVQNDDAKVLGLLWNTREDELQFCVNWKRINDVLLNSSETPTKRMALKILMMIYDPLGFLGFFIVHGKLILKDIWRSGINWDEKIKPEQLKKWKQWMNALNLLEIVKIPRCYSYQTVRVKYELHTFVDASETAAAAVTYLVIFNEMGQEVAFVSSKTKIAPNKYYSIPRMELQAALIGARLATTIQSQQSIPITKLTFWSDSKNVLHWIRSPKSFKPFVAHRIGEILELTNSHDWRWVPTNQNIADEATKWKLQNEPKIPNMWFTGPEFLTNDVNKWPTETNEKYLLTDEELEVRCLTISNAENFNSLVPDFSRFSKYDRLIRTQAYILRFFYRKRVKTGLTSQEINYAKLYVIRSVQKTSFRKEIHNLERNVPVEKSSPLHGYSPFLDDQQIIRMKSRLLNAEYLTYDQRHPIILPRQHRFTHLVITKVHEQFYHANHNTVVNEIQQQFVIPQLRCQLKSIRAKCQRCKILNAKPEVPEMAALPRSRLAVQIKPFSYSGVDYFGPLTVKHGRKTEKKWGCIFTCLTTRAVHIEIVSSLSSDAFLMVLRIFISRRGMPLELFSDNGTNFKGAQAELRLILRDNLKDAVLEHFTNIKWTFNPPAAPHMGGAWERLIRSVKSSLMNVLPTRTPTEDLLRCILTEIEAIVNSRPLTYVETDHQKMEALTPNHFLLGCSGGLKSYGKFTDDVHIMRKEWKKQQHITQLFWKRWVTEYLPEISKRTQWYDPVIPIQVNDVVAIVQEDTPYCWKLGRITAVIKSADGAIRQADVQTDSIILRRPVSKLAVLVREQN